MHGYTFVKPEKDPLLVNSNEIVGSPEERMPIFRMVALTLCFLGVQFGWAVQVAFTVPLFLELGVPKFWVSYVWLAGPISGLLVQPSVGVLSDRTTLRFGRRRPYILFGSIFIVVGMILISNAGWIGMRMTGEGTGFFAIALAVTGFWILDLSNNTVQGPCRALLVDLAPKSQQNLGGSLFSFMLGTGNLLGYLVGSLPLQKWFPFFGTDIRALFMCGMVVLVTCVTITLVLAKEKPLPKAEVPTGQNPFRQLLSGITNMPKGMQRICAVQFFAWFGWFTFLLYITSWMATSIYRGDPNADAGTEEAILFDEGVRFGSLALTVFSAVTMVFSVILPTLTRLVGIKPIFMTCQLILALCLFLPLFVKDRWVAFVLISFCGFPWTCVMVFPFSIVAMVVPETESGMYMGVLNIFVVVPQMVVAITMGFLVDGFHGWFAPALAAGGISAIISAVFIKFLIIPPVDTVTLADEIKVEIQNDEELNQGKND